MGDTSIGTGTDKPIARLEISPSCWKMLDVCRHETRVAFQDGTIIKREYDCRKITELMNKCAENVLGKLDVECLEHFNFGFATPTTPTTSTSSATPTTSTTPTP